MYSLPCALAPISWVPFCFICCLFVYVPICLCLSVDSVPFSLYIVCYVLSILRIVSGDTILTVHCGFEYGGTPHPVCTHCFSFFVIWIQFVVRSFVFLSAAWCIFVSIHLVDVRYVKMTGFPFLFVFAVYFLNFVAVPCRGPTLSRFLGTN